MPARGLLNPDESPYLYCRMEKEIYMDYNATTPVDARVLETMLPFFTEKFANAASVTHASGREAARSVETARKKTAALLHCSPEEIIFTSGSTESLNLAIKGCFEYYSSKGNHIITVKTEHKAVLDTCAYLEQKRGARVTYLHTDREGRIDADELKEAMSAKTILVAVMLANNETGVIQPLKEIAEITHAHQAIVLSDTTQAAGKMVLDVNEYGIDLACISAHKMYGPKGCGALFVRRKNPRVSLVPQLHGGGHERGLRPGTLNVAGIAGLGQACEIAAAEMWEDNTRISVLRGKLEHQLLDLPGVRINGSTRHRLYNTANICFRGKNSIDMLKQLSGFALAFGSACTSALPQPSHVLKAMGMSDEDVFSSVRFSLGKYTAEAEINAVVQTIKTKIYGAA